MILKVGRHADLQTRTSNLVIFPLRLAGKMYRYTKFSMKENIYIYVIFDYQPCVPLRFGRKSCQSNFGRCSLWDKQLITAATPTYSQKWNPPTWYQVGCTPGFLNLSTSFGEVTCIDRISPYSSLGPWGVKNSLSSMGSTEASFPSFPSFRPWGLDPRFALDGHFHADPHPGNLLVEKGTDRRRLGCRGWCWHRVDWKRPKRWEPKIIEP